MIPTTYSVCTEPERPTADEVIEDAACAWANGDQAEAQFLATLATAQALADIHKELKQLTVVTYRAGIDA